MPACETWITHSPAESIEAMVPETVHIEGVSEVKATAKLELAEAERVTLAPAN